jgi:nucleotide-binding universal stress UspA family protein
MELLEKRKKVLFGIDDSVFARQALSAVGGLLKDSEDLRITIFHGGSDPEFFSRLAVSRQAAGDLENYQKSWSLEEEKVLERAKVVLTDSGFNPDRVATIYEERCNDPAGSMYKLSILEDYETLAVARGRTPDLGRGGPGGVTHRLGCLADDRVVWVIDPRVLSHNVLVTLVGAPISRRLVEHTVRYLGHLQGSRFTFLHVIPPVPPQAYKSSYWVYQRRLSEKHGKETMARWNEEYMEEVKKVAHEGKEKLVEAGVPENDVVVKINAEELPGISSKSSSKMITESS